MTNCVNSIPPLTDSPFDQACPAYAFGEVERVLILEAGSEKPTEIETDPHVIPVKGTIDEPEQPEVETSLYRKAYPPARYTLSCTVDDISDAAYNHLRDMNGARGVMWFQAGDYLYGGDGIECDVKTFLSIEEGEEALQKVGLECNWRSDERKMPEREASPWAEVTS